MENRKLVKLIFSTLMLVILILPAFVLAYSDKTTHPALTDETVDLFNYYYPELDLSDEEKEFVKTGSVDEDTAPRWVNHFYDPVNNIGLWGSGLSSKSWSQDTLAQAGVGSNSLATLSIEKFSWGLDYSWDRAVFEYVHGDKDRALETLGHVLHLIQDASVPAHTRNDGHPPVFNQESPYEQWAAKFTDENFHLSEKLISDGDEVVFYSSLDKYFDNLALYSNNNFFSKDTINVSEYHLPLVNFEEENHVNGLTYGYKTIGGNDFRLVWIKKIKTKRGIEKEYYIVDDDFLVLTDYWTLLSKQAVLHGAGVIKLFFDEVEEEKRTLALLGENKSFTSRMFAAIGGFFAKPFKSDQQESGADTWVPESQVDTIAGKQILELSENVETDPPQPQDNGGLSDSPQIDVNDLASQLENARISAEQIKKDVDNMEEKEKEKTVESEEVVKEESTVSPFMNFASAGASVPAPGFGGGMPSIEEAPQSGGSGGGMTVVLPPQDPSTATSTPTTATTTPVDTTPPDISFNIEECANSLSTTACLVATTTLNLFWSSSAIDLDYYELTLLRQGYGGQANNGTTSTTTATSTILTLSNNSSNSFSVRAKDTTGNWSNSSTTAVDISTMPVIINEIAWAGTNASPHDEWIELHNRTSHTINLDNWILKTDDDKPRITLSGTIPPNGYYLMERKDDDTVGNINADLIYGNDGPNWALNNSGEILTLSHASTTIDQTVLTAPNNKWPAGLTAGKRTMERYGANTTGNDLANWGTNIGLLINGEDASGSPVNGTPKARNSVTHLINKDQKIDSDLTLYESMSPYFVNDKFIEISDGATLTIEPGVVVKFYNNAGLNIEDGKILANGTVSKKVVFTSFYDDDYGGDFNGDATSMVPEKGNWYGVRLKSEGSSFDHTIFRYGGKFYTPVFTQSQANLSLKNCSANISNSIFEYSKAYGLKLTNSTSTVSNNIFRYNKATPGMNTTYTASGLKVEGGSSSIQNNSFAENRYGLRLSNSNSVVDSNSFASSSLESIYSFGILPDFTNNTGSNNDYDRIALTNSITAANATSTLKPNPMPYVLRGQVDVVASSTLVVESGTTIKSTNIGSPGFLNIYGNLITNGISSSDILFDSDMSTQNKGDWYGIRMKSGSYSDIKGVTIGHAKTALTYENSPINLSNVKFLNNNLAISADVDSIIQTVASSTIEFVGNVATTTPGLW